MANHPQKVYFQVVSDVDESNPKAKKEGVEFSKAELIEVKQGSNKVINELPIEHIHNGRGHFTIKPTNSGSSSKEFVLYFLKIYKTSDDVVGKEFELPKVEKQDKMSAMLENGIEYMANGNQTILLNLYTDSDQEERKIQILNKDIVVYTHKLVVGAEYLTQVNISTNLYEQAPNGGVLVLRISSPDTTAFERLLFLDPDNSSGKAPL